MFKQNLMLKILSLAVAVLVWIQLTLFASHKTLMNMDLYVSSADNPDSVFLYKERVPFFVEGTGMDLLRITINRTQILIPERDRIAGDWSRIKPLDDPVLETRISFSPDPKYLQAAEDAIRDDLRFQRGDNDPEDPVITRLLELRINFTGPGQIFPDTATLLIKGRKSSVINQSSLIKLSVVREANARDMNPIQYTIPGDLELLSITPSQVYITR